jgi:alkylated DNA repair dioxygenase AlkB
MTYQPSILDDVSTDDRTGDGGPALADLGRARRTTLSHGAWVDHLPGWVEGSDAVFRTLVTDVDWRAERRRMFDIEVAVPRLLRWYAAHEVLPHPVLTDAREALGRHYREVLGEPFTTAGMCLYRDGRDSVAWHGDTIGRSSTEDTLVAIVSLGAPRALLLRPRNEPGRGHLRFTLGHGDLLVMGGSCQRTWEHAVPKTAQTVGPRISVQFRPHGVA